MHDEGVRITLLGSLLNVLLMGMKFGVGLAVGSVALVADGVHSLSDFATDLVVLGGLRLASRPADRTHSYGHGKFETLAGALVALALLGAGGWLVWEAGLALYRHIHSFPGSAVVGVAILSIIGKEWLFRITRRVAQRLGSSALEANAWHHRTDAFSSVAVLFGGVAAMAGFGHGDQLAGIFVGVLILAAAARILREALHELLEGALGELEINQIIQAIENVDGVKSWHRLRTRYSGREAFVDVHIQVAPSLSVSAAHDIASQVEEAVRSALGGQASVIVHVEPWESKDEE